MPVYVALLRGINVGGHQLIRMSELKQVFESFGLQQVQTYIQSGNVLFTSDEVPSTLQPRIEQGLNETMGKPVDVILRTSAEIEQIVANCPFTDEAIAQANSTADGETQYVALLQNPLTGADVERLENATDQYDTFVAAGQDIYLLFGRSIRNSRLANQLGKLSSSATTRNWKTMTKLAAMAHAMAQTVHPEP